MHLQAETSLMANENDVVVIRDMNEFQNLIRKWVRRYHEKPASMSDEQWMAQELSVELAEIPFEEHHEFSNLLMKQINSISAAKVRVQEADEQGMDKKEWLYRELQGAASGLQVHEFGEYLSGIDATIEQCNLEWKKV